MTFSKTVFYSILQRNCGVHLPLYTTVPKCTVVYNVTLIYSGILYYTVIYCGIL